MSDSPLVTIAIPTHNPSRLPYLKEAVAYALAQMYRNIEVFISDDGTAHAIKTWSEGIVAREPRVRYQRNLHNLGLAGNWNALAQGALGEFIVIIGDDDRLLPDFVEKLVSVIQPGARVAFSNHYLINAGGARLEVESKQHTRQYCRDLIPPGELADAEAWVWRNSIPISAALLRTEDVCRLKFKEDLNTPEIELFIRLAQEGGRFRFVPEYLAEYRVHPESATSTGLWGDRLADYLLPMRVREEIEPVKRKFIGSLLVDVVNSSLRQSDRQAALKYFSSEYYPRPYWRHVKGCVHWLCLSLPTVLGLTLYKYLLLGKSILEVESKKRTNH